ncbi:putative cytochrome P450 [Lepidopterella palustris CBS 459.81]|uniref:Putative cytochrome P450 n=1 Tax=Lepidopterella palustris CBS 459.81 TaxID=1314670 RepID=A0A8E2DWZ2_9PEZI|nr:putative cytochrome P450 [Lepidopterella palustris CBS 459.81]
MAALFIEPPLLTKVTLCIASTLAFFLLRIIWLAFTGPLVSLPGPFISKVTNLVLKFYTLNGFKMQYVHALHQKYGPIVRISRDEVAVSDLQTTKKIHQIGARFRKTEWYSKLNTSQEHNIFTLVDPKAHQARRRLLSHPLSEKSLKELEPVVVENVKLAIRQIRKQIYMDGYVDLLRWFFFLATDIIGQLSFGESFRMLEYGKENQYSIDLKKVTFYNSLLVEIPYIIKPLSLLPLHFIKDLMSVGARRTCYAQESLQRYREYLKTNPDTDKPMLLSRHLKANGAGTLNKAEVESDTEAYILGGSDTTAVTLTYLIWAVSRHPEVQKRVIEEVQELPEIFNSDDLKGLPYMNMVIEETLRLYGAAPAGLPRAVPAEGRTLCGHFVPGGYTVTAHAFTLHRDERIFPSPEKFEPSRWANPTQNMKDAFMPFGGGGRICLGLHLARLELRMTLAHFYRAFPKGVKMASGMSDVDMEMENYFLIAPKAHHCLMTEA